MDFETVVGFEIHAELATQSKIFCGCSTAFGQPPNLMLCFLLYIIHVAEESLVGQNPEFFRISSLADKRLLR